MNRVVRLARAWSRSMTWWLAWHELFDPHRCHCGHFADHTWRTDTDVAWCTACKYGSINCPCSHPPYDFPDPPVAPRWFRVWFYRPQWYWYGWLTLLPVYRGNDEYDRWTLMLGWTVTGRIVIAFWR